MVSEMWCALCTREWQTKDMETRKTTNPSRAVTKVNGTPVCGPHIDEATEMPGPNKSRAT